MFAEDMSVFFSAAEFAVNATFTPLGKPPTQVAVLFNSPTQEVFSTDMLTDEFEVIAPAAALAFVESGTPVEIGGARYRVREVRLMDDGALRRAKLTKV